MGGRLNAETFAVGERLGCRLGRGRRGRTGRPAERPPDAPHHRSGRLRPRHLFRGGAGSATTCRTPARQAPPDAVAHLFPAGRSWPPAPPNARLRSKTTTVPASCWRGPCAPMPTAGAWRWASGWRFSPTTTTGLRTATDLQAKGVDVVAVIDTARRRAAVARHPPSARGRGGRLRRASGPEIHHHPRCQGPTRNRGLRCAGHFGRLEPQPEHRLAPPLATGVERGACGLCAGAGRPAGPDWPPGQRRASFPPMPPCDRATRWRAPRWTFWALTAAAQPLPRAEDAPVSDHAALVCACRQGPRLDRSAERRDGQGHQAGASGKLRRRSSI